VEGGEIMKKKVINKTIRNIMVVFLTCAIAIFSYGIYYLYNLPLQDKIVAVFNYDQKAIVNYSVFYKPNILGSETSLKEGNIYITNYVDYINTLLDYSYSGETNADIRGDYSITAVVEALEGRNVDLSDGENEVKTIWSKDFVLIPKTSFSASDKNFSIKKELPVYLADFQDFVKQVAEESGVTGNHRLTIRWDINLETKTDKGIIKESLTPTMVVPLGSSYFEIGGERAIEKPGSIEEVIQVEDPQKQNKLIICSILAGLCGLILLLVLTCTKGKLQDKLEREIKQIFKKHGERLVELDTTNEILFDSKDLWPVKTIEDLVRIADEISKPIIYQYDDVEDKKVPVFYVCDEKKVFFYKLAIPEREKPPVAQYLTQPDSKPMT
jgi:hypothetical protein